MSTPPKEYVTDEGFSEFVSRLTSNAMSIEELGQALGGSVGGGKRVRIIITEYDRINQTFSTIGQDLVTGETVTVDEIVDTTGLQLKLRDG